MHEPRRAANREYSWRVVPRVEPDRVRTARSEAPRGSFTIQECVNRAPHGRKNPLLSHNFFYGPDPAFGSTDPAPNGHLTARPRTRPLALRSPGTEVPRPKSAVGTLSAGGAPPRYRRC